MLHLAHFLAVAELQKRAPLGWWHVLQYQGTSPAVGMGLGVARSVRPLPRRLGAVCQSLVAALGGIEAVPWWRRRRAFAQATVMSARSDCLWRCKRLAFELVVVLNPTTTLSVGGPNHSHRSSAQIATAQTLQEPTGGCQSSEPKHYVEQD